MTDFSVRRVVTQVNADGSAAFASDGAPPKTISVPTGFGVSELLWFDGAPADRDAGRSREPEEPDFPLEPPPGGMSSRIIRLPGADDWLRVPHDDPERPGMHTTDTLDLMVVLEGTMVLGLEADEVELGAGDVVIQRRTNHRWRTSTGCTYWATMLRPDPSQQGASLTWATDAKSPVRRVITDGAIAHDGYAPTALDTVGITLVDVWQTGAPLATATQGGDTGEWDLEPAGGGVAMRWFEMPPAHDVGLDVGWHTSATIDVLVVLAGRIALELPGGPRAELGAGDAVVQRATEHRWLTLGDEPVRMAAVMFAVPS